MSTKNTLFGTGRIRDIISYLKTTYQVDSVKKLSAQVKLDALCEVIQFTPTQLDTLIVGNSPVLRTIQGHAFEIVFEHLVTANGNTYTFIGGDTNIDGTVNNNTLQLKTPYKSGTRGIVVSYKSHKTHGAKSEAESMEYYTKLSSFPDVLVGLISYSPFQVIFLRRNEIPTHPKDPDRILSPFTIKWEGHLGLNSFERIGITSFDITCIEDLIPVGENELLPKTATILQLRTDHILNTILMENNFRIWDMNIRGFAREFWFINLLLTQKIIYFDPKKVRLHRGDKADLALRLAEDKRYVFFQMKGVSINCCSFNGINSIVGVETQLTRGRVNDHPTQSRLYLDTDFDYLIVGLDPPLVQRYNLELEKQVPLHWEFYVLPVARLARHSKFLNRLKSVQSFRYQELQQYRVSSEWFAQWEREEKPLQW